jgi:acetyl-CoA carboxylase carboxyltransferase component
MTWQSEIEELRRRQALAREHGGIERVQRHKAAGKLTARERIDALLDPGSFREVGSIAGTASYDADGHISTFMPAHLVMVEARSTAVPSSLRATTSPCAEARLMDS